MQGPLHRSRPVAPMSAYTLHAQNVLRRMSAAPWRRSFASSRRAHQTRGRPSSGACSAVAPASEATAGSQLQQSKAYPFTEIEAKWQALWDELETFKVPRNVDTSKPKHYVLDMFPYPRCRIHICM